MYGEVWAHKTSLTPPLLIEMPVPSQESELSCICVLMVSILPFSKNFYIEFFEMFRYCSIFCFSFQFSFVQNKKMSVFLKVEVNPSKTKVKLKCLVTAVLLYFLSNNQILVLILGVGLSLWYLPPLSTLFQLYRGGEIYWWRKLEKTTVTCRKSLTNLSHYVVSSTPRHERVSNSQPQW